MHNDEIVQLYDFFLLQFVVFKHISIVMNQF